MSSSDRGARTSKELTADDIALAALSILQRGLPPGDLNDRQVVTELWGVFDNASARHVLEEARKMRALPANGDRAP